MGIVAVSGTSTEVGKTVTTAAVAALARSRDRSVAVVKPAQTGLRPGEPGDLAEIERLAPGVVTYEYARYPDPLSPEAAARQAGDRPLRLTAVAKSIAALEDDYDLVLIEGAGGLLVRFGPDGWTLADLAWAVQAPVLLVAAAGLGTLNHTALTVEALDGRGVPLAGLVIGSWPTDPDLATRCNVVDLETVTGRPLDGVLPAGAPHEADFLAVAAAGLDASWGGTFDAMAFRASIDPAPAAVPQ
ncbi:dethiobiotin synthase [Cryptosporangium aurantiacum]|uniref:ATP-dependent dethiobiotin synthetase BioD n=1 Tax=Cryptosporangium aurantiacum TaxID=134849 RepID=A0A1M7QNA7_9ACTN|nr:dethiobiotin synthase [Cryptosporangium aurantiacum]SHN32588.1 dethiobiotin synthetase [Cryptosporangium aurantiacum]